MSLELFESAMDDYERAIAVKEWRRAIQALNRAIEECPVKLALPVLSSLLDNAIAQAKEPAWWQRLLGLARAA